MSPSNLGRVVSNPEQHRGTAFIVTLHGDTSLALYKIFSSIPAKYSCCDLDKSGNETVKKSPNYPLTADIFSHTSICGHQSGCLVSNLSFYPDLSNLGDSRRPAPGTLHLAGPGRVQVSGV